MASYWDDWKKSQAGKVTASAATYPRSKSVTCWCLECQKEFLASRSDAKFCSANCRKESSRRKERVRRESNNAIACLRRIEELTSKYPDVGIIAGIELERVKDKLNVTLAAVT